MSLVGLINPTQFLTDFSKTSKRDDALPYIMMKGDRLLVLAALSVPSITLAISIFLGSDMYHMSGIELSPIPRKFDRWTEVGFVKSYCWANFETETENGQIIPLWHYPYYPFIMFTITVIIWSAKLIWRFGDFQHLTHGLNYVLDALEESIRDLIESLMEETKSNTKFRSLSFNANKPNESGDNVENNNALNNLPESELKVQETNLDDLEKQPLANSTEDLSNDQSYVIERNLAQFVTNFHDKMRRDAKYRNFNQILKVFATNSTYQKKFRNFRMYFLIIMLAVEGFVYWIFLVPSRNPYEVQCPLPPQFYQTDENGVEVTRTLALFAPVVIRTTILWTMWIANLGLILAAGFVWKNSNTANSMGMRLLQNLPSVTIDKKYLTKSSDLSYLMKLVYVNRNRLEFVRFGFNMMAASDAKVGKKSKEGNFLSIFRETILWMQSLDKDSQLKKIVTALNENMESG